MLKKVIIFTILNFLILFCIGKIFFDDRTFDDYKMQRFLYSLENQKIGIYYIDFNKLGKTHNSLIPNLEDSKGDRHSLCYEILPDRLVRSGNCTEDIIITFDKHAVGSFITASFNPKGIIFSEFLFGHVKIKGLSFSDILSVILW